MTAQNLLAESGKPLFFPVGNFEILDMPPPPIRHDDAVRMWARSLTEMQKEAVVFSAKTGKAWRLASDEGAYLNGFDEAPCPLSFMTVGMVSSFMNEISAQAKQQKVDLSGMRLQLDNYYTMTGSALKGTMTGGALNPELRVQFESSPPPAAAQALPEILQNAVQSAPIGGLLRGEHHSLFSLGCNGTELKPGQVQALGFHLPDTTARIEEALPDNAVSAPLIAKTGITEKTSEDTSAPGSSLRPEQNRQLHVRGICTLLDDTGLKKIEQHLFNPRGSIFEFFCDESVENGGGGRAPDAHTYIAAGLGFCFMTQFGRYAKIVRKDLPQYNIAQDLHFGAGITDPAQTHVYLKTGEGDDFARAALDAGEKTCFLHALCRTDLNIKISGE